MSELKWERIPKSEYKHIITLIDTFNYAGLINIHDKYKLSGVSYCCGNAVLSLFDKFKLKKNKKYFDND